VSVISSLGAKFAAGVDRAFASAFLGRSQRSRKRSRAESLGPEEREQALRAIAALYARAEHFETPETFFPAPARIATRETEVRRQRDGGRVVDLVWESAYRCHVGEVQEKYGALGANASAHARVMLHPDTGAERRPAVILVHGYLGGVQALEERAWPLRWLYERGFDVALPVLPFHGARGKGALRPPWPSSDPRMNVEGFRQAMNDLRGLRAWLAARGATAVGAMGMSLGGYTTALFATVEPELAFAVPFIPLASIADFARDGGRLVGTPAQQELQYQLLEDAHRVVSPLARPPRVPRDRLLIVAGEADRITPLAHAQRLADHFGARLEPFPGGHLLQLGRSDAFRAVGRMLGEAGLLPRRDSVS
jgi:dienelactone hydrolase